MNAVKSRTFFSQWGPPTLMGGIFVVLGVFGFVTASLKPGYSGISDLFHHGAGYVFAAVICLGILLWFTFFCRVRFEETSAVIWYCSIFPVRIHYADINHLTYFYQKYRKKECPAVIYFHLRSGEFLHSYY